VPLVARRVQSDRNITSINHLRGTVKASGRIDGMVVGPALAPVVVFSAHSQMASGSWRSPGRAARGYGKKIVRR
jgi:hypothetical protein